ncbi:MAG: N-acetyl-gamma-glutamyl-phosphate reductase [Candidatus Rokubacteria bacterium]|jgi:N-acetyl-gamma-glutamyl-phosphate reductase|nr:N-acetyl-gamma-glutamyl-phosphate reductase [Candidatus Rokubacteria bacterium]
MADGPTLKVAVAGATGYTGAELLRLLLVHPKVRLTAVMASERSAGMPVGRLIPSLRGQLPLTVEKVDAERLAAEADCVLLALPYGETHRVVSVLRRHGRRVIDLSSDYRLRSAAEFEAWYKTPHTDPEGLAEAVYGLPELYRKEIAASRLVANPGCYPTGALLAIAPLIKSGLGRPEGIVVDAKSGVTGAGSMSQKPDPMYLYAEQNENLLAYGVGKHRHTPEIEQALSGIVGAPVQVTFTPHLIPMNRGLFTTAYVPLARRASTAECLEVYREAYAQEPFVRVLEEGELPRTRAVVGSNLCDLTVVVEGRTGHAICLSAIDNLGKGGAANAIQNLNIVHGWDERLGLAAPPVYP